MASRIIACNNCGSREFSPLVTFRDSKAAAVLGDQFTVGLCKRCGLCFLNPQPTHEDYLAYYRIKGKSGGAAVRHGSPQAIRRDQILRRKRHYRAYARWIAKRLALPKSARILELGCSFGALLHFFREAGYENVEGVEASERSAEAARRELGLSVTTGDALAPGLPAGSFDLVIGMALIEHFTDPLAAIKTMAGLVKPGGFLYLNTHDLKNFTARKGFKSFFKFVHPFYFTAVTLSSLLEQAGFRIVASQSLPAVTASANFFFPENCLHGELNIIARKTGDPPRPPQGEDYRNVIRRYRRILLRDLPYALASSILFMRWGIPLRKIRKKFFLRFRKDAHAERERFFAGAS